MNLIDCKPIRAAILEEVKMEVEHIFADTGKRLKLVVIQVGDDPASNVYIRNKLKTAEEVGIECEHIKLPTEVGYDTVEKTIIKYGLDNDCTGLMIQLPLPKHLQKYQQQLLDCISFFKDVDALSTTSSGKLVTKQPCITPATAQGVANILKDLTKLEGKHCVIVGRSSLVGKPLVFLLEQKNCTVTLCHSKTQNLKELTSQADIVICAIGKPKYFDVSYFKDDAIVIDIGINRDENNKLVGDVNLESLDGTNVSVTPTPGGTGVITTAQLMANVVKAYKLQHGKLL